MRQTHYDTLKVSRDAPIEVIRAAYRVLSQKHHPDRNPSDSAAADTMGLLNKAYEVLSAPERRHAHDGWIRQIEAESWHVRTSKMTPLRPARVYPEQEIGSDAALVDRIALHLRQSGILYGSVLLALVSLVVVLSVAQEPQMNSWVAATPAPEDRENRLNDAAGNVMPGVLDQLPVSASGSLAELQPPPVQLPPAQLPPADPQSQLLYDSQRERLLDQQRQNQVLPAPMQEQQNQIQMLQFQREDQAQQLERDIQRDSRGGFRGRLGKR